MFDGSNQMVAYIVDIEGGGSIEQLQMRDGLCSNVKQQVRKVVTPIPPLGLWLRSNVFVRRRAVLFDPVEQSTVLS